MCSRKQGWTGLLKREGSDFLAWARDEGVLSLKFDVLSKALSLLLRERVRTPEEAHDVWEAVQRCFAVVMNKLPMRSPGLRAPTHGYICSNATFGHGLRWSDSCRGIVFQWARTEYVPWT